MTRSSQPCVKLHCPLTTPWLSSIHHSHRGPSKYRKVSKHPTWTRSSQPCVKLHCPLTTPWPSSTHHSHQGLSKYRKVGNTPRDAFITALCKASLPPHYTLTVLKHITVTRDSASTERSVTPHVTRSSPPCVKLHCPLTTPLLCSAHPSHQGPSKYRKVGNTPRDISLPPHYTLTVLNTSQSLGAQQVQKVR